MKQFTPMKEKNQDNDSVLTTRRDMFCKGNFSRSERFLIDSQVSFAAGDKDEATSIENELEIVSPVRRNDFMGCHMTPSRAANQIDRRKDLKGAIRIAVNLTSE